jgi:hypothetical protein
MKISKSAVKWKILASVFAMLFFLNASSLFAENASIIQIGKASGEGKDLTLSPPELFVQKGTVVIWMNGIQGEEIQVVFKEGKACKDVSFSPEYKGFSLDSKSCFVTSFIPYAATSSLQFTEKGTFEYTVSNATGRIAGKGKVTVQEK